MTYYEIPLSAQSQILKTSINGVTYGLRVLWRGTNYFIDLLDSRGNALITAMPMVTGVDLLEPYSYMKLGFEMYVTSDLINGHQQPTYEDLGITSHLYVRY